LSSSTGVQIYRCDAKKDQPGQFEWGVFQSPEAMLRDAGGKYVGRHYSGTDVGSRRRQQVAGTVQARRDDAKSIPWLRLSTRSHGPAGEFSSVTTILRIRTSGGVAPAAGCNDAERG